MPTGPSSNAPDVIPYQSSRSMILEKSNVDSLLHLGKLMTASGFFQDSKQAAQAAVKILAGRELGLGPMASMTGVYIVKGRPCLSANMMAAVIAASPLHRYRVKELTSTSCTLLFFRRYALGDSWEEQGDSTFTLDDAKTAGLLGNQTWKAYPRNMLFARAMSNGARWYCPDLFSGVPPYLPEELAPKDVAMVEDGSFVVPAHVSKCEPMPVNPELARLLQETATDPEKVALHFGCLDLESMNAAEQEQAIKILRSKLETVPSDSDS